MSRAIAAVREIRRFNTEEARRALGEEGEDGQV